MWITHKLTLIFAVALVALMVAATLGVDRLIRVTVEDDQRARLDLVAQRVDALVQRLTASTGRMSMDSLIHITRYVFASERQPIEAVMLELRLPATGTRVGPVLLRGAELQLHPLSADGQEITALELQEVLRHQVSLFYPQFEVGIEFFASSREARRLSHGLSRTFLLVTGAGFFLLLTLSFVLTHQLVSSPLQELARLHGRIADGELTVDASQALLQRDDEVGQLSGSFQKMLLALRRARDDNQALLAQQQGFNRQLEVRVKQATRALEEKSQALIEAREELAGQERMAALGQLAGTIAHEIGTPLSTLSGCLQLALASRALSPELREQLELASGEALRVTQIIRRFLNSTRGLRPSPETLALEPLLREVVALTFPSAARANLELAFELDSDLRLVQVDPLLLRQVLSNLLRNASDAMGGSGKLTLRATRDDRCLVLEVEDQGPGVARELRERVFDPFYTSKAPEAGTGLGLAISREIVHALKGSLVIGEPRGGVGARFILRLPGCVVADVQGEAPMRTDALDPSE